MRTSESYMQESFQLHPDEGESSDHSFKAAGRVKTFFRTGKVYSASYDSLSLHGFVNFNRFCHTKSNDELQPILADNARIREQMGAPELRLTQGDGGGDSSAWKKKFHIQLMDSAFKLRKDDLPLASLRDGKYQVYSSARTVENLFLALATKLLDSKKVVFGLDTEADDHQQTRVIQICLPSKIFDKVIVLDLTSIGALSRKSFGEKLPNLKTILTNKKMIPVAVNVTYDVNQLDELGLHFESYIDVMNTARELEPSHREGFGLQALCRRYLQCHVRKELQKSDWERPLTAEMGHYAALDAFLHLFLFENLQNKIHYAQRNGQLPISASQQIEVDQEINLLFNRKIVATGILKFVGSQGKMKKFGEATVGKGKALVLIQHVLDHNVRPPFGFKPTKREQDRGILGWDHTKETLKSLLQRKNGPFEVAWPTSRLTVKASTITQRSKFTPTETVENYLLQDGRTSYYGHKQYAHTAPPAPKSTQHQDDNPSNEEESICSSEEDGWLFEEEDFDQDDAASISKLPRSRQRHDRFHIFQAFPSSRDPKIRAPLKLVQRLIVHALTEFDPDDFEQVKSYLGQKKKIFGMENLMDHFYFNREWWYRRVRVYPPSAKNSCNRLAAVANSILETEVLKKAWTPPVAAWFHSTMELCRLGKLEESPECKMYQWDGEDKNGLHLYIRYRGSNRSELLHQKMRIACGSHGGIGIEVGHYLMLMVTYRFNIATGIRRKNWHDFGMPYLHLVDRVQTRIIQLYDVDPFPKHYNLSLAPTIQGIVCVGVGPLNYGEHYVQAGNPHPKLQGNMLFLAEKMKLECPPLHISHPHEKRIFNDYILEHPSPSSRDWHQLACIFKQKTDAIFIFPKLPSMLKAYFNRWRTTQQVVALQDNVKSEMYLFLKKFGTPPKTNSVAMVFQKKQSDCAQQRGIHDESTALAPSNSERNKAKLSRDPMPVAPVVAPYQTVYVPSTVTIQVPRAAKSCSGLPFGCNRPATECCGANRGWEYCKGIIEGSLSVPPTKSEQERVLHIFWTGRKRLQQAERRKRRKKDSETKDAAMVLETKKLKTGAIVAVQSTSTPQVITITEVIQTPSVILQKQSKSGSPECHHESRETMTPAERLRQCIQEVEDKNLVTEGLFGTNRHRSNAEEVMAQEPSGKGYITVLRKNLETLREGEWLNDEVINFYFCVLLQRREKRCLFLKSNFYTQLIQDGHKTQSGQYKYSQVNRWTKGIDIFDMEKVFFPINVFRRHWFCAMIDVTQQKIQLFDSGGKCHHRSYLRNILRFLKDEHQEKRNCSLPDIDKWVCIGSTSNVPVQENGK